ncbi:hypothetical protein F5884DRAFT_174537 [Xylogone sp. PMI_703]|nr:hypothetical protein F5884DRAFT_174537 [Xylogone sp. PMI_703]
MESLLSFVSRLKSAGIFQRKHQPHRSLAVYWDSHGLPEVAESELCAEEAAASEKAPEANVSLPVFKLSELPPELIYSIAKFLPLEAAAVLSLTCRDFNDILGKQFLQPLMKKSGPSHAINSLDEFYAFLELMGIDYPNHVPCLPCRRLHRVTVREALRYIPRSRDWSQGAGEGCVMMHLYKWRYLNESNWFFSRPIFRMTMKRLQQGRDYAKYLKLLSPKELRLCTGSTAEWTSSLAQIHGENLLLRRQTIWTPNPVDRDHDREWWFQPCAHTKITGIGPGTISCYYITPDRTNIRDYDQCKKGIDGCILQCRYCYTEFCIGFTKLSGKRTLTSTVWNDLGKGKSDLDLEWLYHINGYFRLCPEQLREVSFQPGSISSTFEQGRCSKSAPSISSSEAKDLLNIGKCLRLRDDKKKTERVRQAISEFFEHREDFYVGSKNPLDLYDPYLFGMRHGM